MEPTDIYNKSGKDAILSRIGAMLGGKDREAAIAGAGNTPQSLETGANVAEEVTPDVSKATPAAQSAMPPETSLGEKPEGDLPKVESADGEPAPDLEQPQKWSGPGGWNYEYKPASGKKDPTLTVYSPRTGRIINLGPGSRYFQPILDELQAGKGIGEFDWDPKAAASIRASRTKRSDPYTQAVAEATDHVGIDGTKVSDETLKEDLARPSEGGGEVLRDGEESTSDKMRRAMRAQGDTPASASQDIDGTSVDALTAAEDLARPSGGGGEVLRDGEESTSDKMRRAMRAQGDTPATPVATVEDAVAPIQDKATALQMRALLKNLRMGPEGVGMPGDLGTFENPTTANEDRLRRIQALAAQIPPEQGAALESYIQSAIVAPMEAQAKETALKEQRNAATQDFLRNVADPRYRNDIYQVFRSAQSGELDAEALDQAMLVLPADQARALVAILEKHYGVL